MQPAPTASQQEDSGELAVPGSGLETEAPASPLLAADEELHFQHEIFREHASGNVHSFILHFNVHDFVVTPSLLQNAHFSPLRLRDYLGHLLRSRGFDVVIYYSLSGGLSLLDEAAMQERIRSAIPDPVRKKERYYGQTGGQADGQVPPGDERVVALTHLDRLLHYQPEPGQKEKAAPPRIAVILEYLETICPHEDAGGHDPAATFAIQMLHRWAMDRRLQTRHMVVGLASDLGHVASILYTATSECRPYRVDLPLEETQALSGELPRRQRSDWLQWLTEGMQSEQRINPLSLPGSLPDVQALAGQTSGFNYDNLRDLVYYASFYKFPLTGEIVQARKRDIITAESRELLEIVEPRDGFELVAGYGYVKSYLEKVARAITQQGVDPVLKELIPKGILFLGPPGTGKSYLAAALAKATGFNMVKFKNIRSMWVGESERNLNRVLDLLQGMSPVIVFVDEIDQALGSRQVGGGGDSGVERRIFQRILEFMAQDENRGRILWVAASNRPDGIDTALLSRFDVVMPFLLPDAPARRVMLAEAYPAKNRYVLDPAISADDIGILVEQTLGFSGREIDTLCRQAMMLASLDRLESQAPPPEQRPVVCLGHLQRAIQDFRRAHDPHQYELQTLLAIQNTNFKTFLPSRAEMPPEIIPDEDNGEALDEEKLERRIDELRLWMGRRRMAEYGLAQ